jgi:hypothetical protein
MIPPQLDGNEFSKHVFADPEPGLQLAERHSLLYGIPQAPKLLSGQRLFVMVEMGIHALTFPGMT